MLTKLIKDIRHSLAFALFAAFCGGLANAAGQPPAAQPARELLFLTWSDYMDPAVIREFERKFKAKVRPVYFETDDVRDDMLAETDGRGYDVVVVNSVSFPLYRRRDWLLPIGEAEVPHLAHIDPRWKNALPAATGYGAPYAWGTTGIAYRTDLVPEPITRWRQILQPPEALRGKILMVKAARDVIGAALRTLGYSANSADPRELAEAEQLLLAQKPYVKGYSYVSLGAESELVKGEIAAAMLYNGDALQLKEQDNRIAYVVPQEGTDLWIDYLTVLRSSANQKLALDFINFLNEPKTAARNARFVYFATPNKAAERFLPAKFLRDPLIYPGEDVLKKAEFLAELPPRAIKQRNSIFVKLLGKP